MLRSAIASISMKRCSRRLGGSAREQLSAPYSALVQRMLTEMLTGNSEWRRRQD